MDARPTSGLRGKSQAEKRRIGRLSRSERVIDDPADRQAVEAFYTYMVWYYDQKAKRHATSLFWLAFTLNVSGVVLLFAIGKPALGTVLVVLAAVGLTARFMSHRAQKQLLRTAAINGWGR